MAIQIRTASPETDYDRIADILRPYDDAFINADSIRQWDMNQPPGSIRRRAVAVNDADDIVGYSVMQYHPRSPAGRFLVSVTVDKPHERQGIGTQLYEDAAAAARSHGAREFVTYIAEISPNGLDFAQKRGFVMQNHTFASSLDLTTFDEMPFAELITRAEASGLRFSTLAAEGITPQSKYQIWDLNRRTANDTPSHGDEDSFPTFETFEHQVLNAAWFRADGQFLAMDGDRYVGLGAVLIEPEAPDTAYSAFTGVERDYRGRGIAGALKLLTVRYALQHGARKINTHNDSQNVPMLTINRRFGYQPTPGIYGLLKK